MNLYDPAHLEVHPLVGMLGLSPTPGQTRGQALRELLVDAVEHLRPASGVPFDDPAWCAYRIMRQRYIEVQTLEVICRELGISRTTFYRYHKDALDALAYIVWGKRQTIAPDAERANPTQPLTAKNEAIRVAHSSRLESVNLLEVMATTVGLLRPFLQQEGIEIRIDSSPGIPPTYGSSAAIRQILVNILTESVRCAASSELTLEVHCRSGGVYCRIRPLARSALGGSPFSEPSGLAVSQGLLEVYGGHITVEGDKTSTVASIAFTIPTLRRRSVLVVDDNVELVRLYERYLQAGSYAVQGASDLAAIESALAETPPDLIILDVLMPNEDGWRLLRRFKTEPSTANVPVVICSVLDQPRLALALGAQAVLQKPVSQANLVGTVQKLLDAHSAQNAGHQSVPEGTLFP